MFWLVYNIALGYKTYTEVLQTIEIIAIQLLIKFINYERKDSKKRSGIQRNLRAGIYRSSCLFYYQCYRFLDGCIRGFKSLCLASFFRF